MNEREFCYWLQGLFDVGGVKSLDESQVQIIKERLALAFRREAREIYSAPIGPTIPVRLQIRRPSEWTIWNDWPQRDLLRAIHETKHCERP